MGKGCALCKPAYFLARKRRATKLASNAYGRPYAIFACWWQRPQTPLITEFHSVATRSTNATDRLTLVMIFQVITNMPVIQNAIHVFLCSQQLTHFFSGTTVLSVGFFLFIQELGILRLQLFDLW